LPNWRNETAGLFHCANPLRGLCYFRYANTPKTPRHMPVYAVHSPLELCLWNYGSGTVFYAPVFYAPVFIF